MEQVFRFYAENNEKILHKHLANALRTLLPLTDEYIQKIKHKYEDKDITFTIFQEIYTSAQEYAITSDDIDHAFDILSTFEKNKEQSVNLSNLKQSLASLGSKPLKKQQIETYFQSIANQNFINSKQFQQSKE